MKITYNAGQDALRILFRNAPISETCRQSRGVTLDYDQQGLLVGIELAMASEHISRLPTLAVVEHVNATPGEEMGNI
jgi:YD repeat-containing protein